MTLPPAIPGLIIYVEPQKGDKLIVGVDCAEGNPCSDDSAICVLNAKTMEQCAVLAGKFDPAVTAAHADKIGVYYNHAPVMVERNNHGHASLLWLKDNSSLRRLRGEDKRDGWLSSSKGKSVLYDAVADSVRNGELMLHDPKTFHQLADIEGATLRAPEGRKDDAADACALCVVGAPQASREGWKMEALS